MDFFSRGCLLLSLAKEVQGVLAETTWMNAYNPRDIYLLHPDARLRNDRVRVLAILYHNGANDVFVLDPLESAVMSTFDGSRTCGDISDLCTAFVRGPEKSPGKAEDFVERFIAKFSRPILDFPLPFLVKREDLSPEELGKARAYNPVDFIIPADRWRSLSEDDYRHAFPLSLLWLLTNQCQVDCQYCYMDRPRYGPDELLPWERVCEIMDEAYMGGVVDIKISGGDVLLYPPIFDFLARMEQYDFPDPVIATKAYVSRETADRLAEFRHIDTLQFSIDSTIPEIGDYLVQRPGFVERTLESMSNALSAGLKVEVKTVITPYNLPTIPRLYRDLKARGVSLISLATYVKSAFHHKDKLFNHPDDYRWLEEQLRKLKEEFPDDDLSYQNGPPELNPTSIDERREIWNRHTHCTAGREFFTICANGKVVACEQMPEKEGDFLGDLRIQSIEEVWNGRALDEYLIHPPREKFAGVVCHDCPEEEYTQCQTQVGGCVRDSVARFGTRWAPPSFCPHAPEATREV